MSARGRDGLVLGIESSCDEMAAAVVEIHPILPLVPDEDVEVRVPIEVRQGDRVRAVLVCRQLPRGGQNPEGDRQIGSDARRRQDDE